MELVHFDDCVNKGSGQCGCHSRYIADVKRDATALAETLRDVSDAGVPQALILPQLVLVFREVFGEMPTGMMIPGMNL